MEIDVIIPLYKPGKELFTLLDKLDSQSVPVHEVILLNTEEKYFEQLIYGTRFLEKYQNIKVYHVSKREFDHGGTRRMGVKKSSADIFVMMTQDAMPADDNLIEQLTEPLRDQVAVSYARQLPREDCAPVECYTRDFNYPAQSRIKSAEDLKTLGIKTFLKYPKVAVFGLLIPTVLKLFVPVPAWLVIVCAVFGALGMARLFYVSDKKKDGNADDTAKAEKINETPVGEEIA